MDAKRLMLASLLLAGCNDLRELGDAGGGGGIPTAVQAAFDASCATDDCHGIANAGSLTLSAAAAPGILKNNSTVTGLPLVTLGDVCQSYMAIKLLPGGGDCETPMAGVRMPNGEVTDADRENTALILGWIAGADLPGGGTGGDTDGTGGSTGGPAMGMCGLADVSMSSPLVSTVSDPMTLPADIGAVITNNCGCHLVDDPADFIPPPVQGQSPVPLRTWTDLHTLKPMDPDGFFWYEVLEFRLNSTNKFVRMPPTTYCLEQEVGAMKQADYDLFVAWLAADAPDAATWVAP